MFVLTWPINICLQLKLKINSFHLSVDFSAELTVLKRMNFHAAAEELCPVLVQLHRSVYWSPSFYGSKLRWEASGGWPNNHLLSAGLGRVSDSKAERL